VRLQRGGSAANVAAFAAQRYPTRFIGCVGDDLGGRMLTQELERHGVDVRVQVRDTTGVIVVLVDPDGERRMFPSRGACAHLESVDPAWLDGLQIVHVTAYSFEGGSTARAVLDAVHEVRRRDGMVSMDVSSVGTIDHLGVPDFLDLMGECRPDFISANHDESRRLGLAEGDVPGPNLPRFDHAVLLARHGEGATRVFQDGILRDTVPVTQAVEVRDLTGAGDAFNAAFLTAYLSGSDLVASCQAGHALSARVLASPGASESAPGAGTISA
jgi:sugar/nucleoside kinase (ribokinase family)